MADRVGFWPPDSAHPDTDVGEDDPQVIGTGISGLDVVRPAPETEDPNKGSDDDDEPDGGVFRIRGKYAFAISLGPFCLVIGRTD